MLRRLHEQVWFRRLTSEYGTSVSLAPIETTAEAVYLCALYVALHVVFARAATRGFLDAARFRELVSSLTSSWTKNAWAIIPDNRRDEVEGATGCAAVSLVAIAVSNSYWAREQAGGHDEFDADLFSALSPALRELRPAFLKLKTDLEAGEQPPRWSRSVEEYAKLGYTETTSLRRLDDLDRRYRVWNLEGKTPLEVTLQRENLSASAELEGGVLRIDAPRPLPYNRDGLMRLLLYLIRQNTETPAAVVWRSTESTDNVLTLTWALIPDLEAILEVWCYRGGEPLLRRHSVAGGTPSAGMFIRGGRTLDLIRSRKRLDESSDRELMNRAKELVPELTHCF